MRLTSLFVTIAALFLVSVSSAPAPELPLARGISITNLLGVDFTPRTHYNAPIEPWKAGARPGWYFGAHPERHPRLFCLVGLICRLLDLLPLGFHCPKPPPPQPPNPPSDGYTQTFSNLTGATQAGDYLTFGLVDTVADCKAMCDRVDGCAFANTYHDVNGKDGSTQLTCSLWGSCHDASTATNTGGQTQPDGSVNYIRESDGWCKV
ncbi:hypothetical protein MD484_g7303, partial [Candolleomyces efflorescens]